MLQGGGEENIVLVTLPPITLFASEREGGREGVRNVLGVQLLLSAKKARGVKVVKHLKAVSAQNLL